METKDILKLAASAPIALASAGGAYYMASAETEATDVKVARLEERLDASLKAIEQLREQNRAYSYRLQKTENELVVLKAANALGAAQAVPKK